MTQTLIQSKRLDCYCVVIVHMLSDCYVLLILYYIMMDNLYKFIYLQCVTVFYYLCKVQIHYKQSEKCYLLQWQCKSMLAHMKQNLSTGVT